MEKVDGYLSRTIQRAWPDALVYETADRRWIARRPGLEDVGLGDSFHEAKQAVHAMVAAEAVKRSLTTPGGASVTD